MIAALRVNDDRNPAIITQKIQGLLANERIAHVELDHLVLPVLFVRFSEDGVRVFVVGPAGNDVEK